MKIKDIILRKLQKKRLRSHLDAKSHYHATMPFTHAYTNLNINCWFHTHAGFSQRSLELIFLSEELTLSSDTGGSKLHSKPSHLSGIVNCFVCWYFFTLKITDFSKKNDRSSQQCTLPSHNHTFLKKELGWYGSLSQHAAGLRTLGKPKQLGARRTSV